MQAMSSSVKENSKGKSKIKNPKKDTKKEKKQTKKEFTTSPFLAASRWTYMSVLDALASLGLDPVTKQLAVF